MKNIRLIIVAIALMGASKPPSPSQHISAQPEQSAGTNQQQGTQSKTYGSANDPLFVKVIPLEKGEADRERERGDHDEKVASDNRLISLTADLARYTLYLFAATGLLFFATVGLVIAGFRQIKDARRSIEAAEKSAATAERALTELERPFIYVDVLNTEHNIGTEGWDTDTFQRGKVQIGFRNYGRTPATLNRINVTVSCQPKGANPPIIDPRNTGGRSLPVGVVSTSDRPYFESQYVPTQVFQDQHEIINGKLIIWAVGFVRYTDIFGTNYITGFAQQFDIVGWRFVVWGDQRYNYAHKEKASEIPHETVTTTAKPSVA